MQRLVDSRMAKVVDHANALIFVVDAERRVQFINRALLALTGRAAGEILGTDLARWLAESDRLELERALARCTGGEPALGVDLGFECASGAVVRGVFSVSALHRADGSVESLVAIGQDSTAARTLERHLLQAEKLATLGQLAAGVVHEINNPLTSITVYADFLAKKLRREGGDPADVAMLEKILDGSNRILKCIRDLVNYAKPTSAQLDVLSLNELVDQSVSFCEHILAEARAGLEKQLAPELPPLYGVQDQLQQVLINLITNACHALPPEGGSIWIRTDDADAARGRVAVEVEDDGCGIAEQHLQQIFDPFFTTKPPGQGTGLGLSIVKKIVDHHDGAIEVRSRPGEGTLMRVTLPTRRQAPEMP